jgi:hypothetical protein
MADCAITHSLTTTRIGFGISPLAGPFLTADQLANMQHQFALHVLSVP